MQEMEVVALRRVPLLSYKERNATGRDAMRRNATQRDATRRNATQRKATQRDAMQCKSLFQCQCYLALYKLIGGHFI